MLRDPAYTPDFAVRAVARPKAGNWLKRVSVGRQQVRESVVAEYGVEFGKDGRPVEPDGRLDAPAFHRNHQAIWSVLGQFLAGKAGDVVEAGSGTGQHVVHFARHTPDIT